MKITGIITEYNPLHKGHILHLNKSKTINSSDAVVCVMSGNFVQRGLPAIMDKWERASLALENGVDLVLELPSIYSLSSAEFFAYGSVATLESLGCIDTLCFGSEHGSVSSLNKIAEILVKEPPFFKSKLKELLSEGKSYPSARNSALMAYIKEKNCDFEDMNELDHILNSSNNILGIEYCKSLIRLKSSIVPTTIQREGSSYNDKKLSKEFASATSIREHINSTGSVHGLQNFLPENVYDRILSLEKEEYDFPNPERAFDYIKYRVLSNPESIKNLPDYEEGLHNKIFQSISTSSSLKECVEKIKSKRYTYTRIYRLLFQLFLNFDSFDYTNLRKEKPEYVRVLGFTDRGREILSKIKKEIDIPLISNVSKKHTEILQTDISCTNLYSLLNKSVPFNSDFYKKPIFISKNK